MGRGLLLDNEILITKKHIVLGNVVANFFKKKNIKKVSIIFDFKNKSLIIWGDDPSTIIIGSRLDYGLGVGTLAIRYPELSKYKSSGEYKTKRQLTSILISLDRYINLRIGGEVYIAKPLNSNAVIIEHMSNMIEAFADTKKFFLNTIHNFFAFGEIVKTAASLKPEDLIRKSSIKEPANITTSPTLSPNTTQSQTSQHNVTAPKYPKTPSTTQTHIHLASPSAPSQIKNVTGIKHKSEPELKSMSEPEINAEKPMSEADIKLENEYKKMILGE